MCLNKADLWRIKHLLQLSAWLGTTSSGVKIRDVIRVNSSYKMQFASTPICSGSPVRSRRTAFEFAQVQFVCGVLLPLPTQLGIQPAFSHSCFLSRPGLSIFSPLGCRSSEVVGLWAATWQHQHVPSGAMRGSEVDAHSPWKGETWQNWVSTPELVKCQSGAANKQDYLQPQLIPFYYDTCAFGHVDAALLMFDGAPFFRLNKLLCWRASVSVCICVSCVVTWNALLRCKSAPRGFAGSRLPSHVV